MSKATSLEELLKERLNNQGVRNAPDTFDAYTHKKGIAGAKSYSDAVSALYARTKKDLSTYGANDRILNNKGLQNSGYSDYIDSLAKKTFKLGKETLRENYASKTASALDSYKGYLESFADKQSSKKRSVMSHLLNNDIVDLNTAIAYGMSAGLSEDEAREVGQNAYELAKTKVFNSILEQTVSLGLDKEGARMLAIKMGISETDASAFADEVSELLEYYGNISKDYLDFLEDRANGK